MEYDLIIIGAGPAGLAAGIYAGRYKLKTLILGKLIGGLASEAYEICNFPSYEKIIGFKLIQKISEQVKNLGVSIKQEDVLEISGENKNFSVKTNKSNYKSKKIILAVGSERKKLELAREKELTGKGVSYCATCDAGFYKDKITGVIGGSDAALTASLLLSKFAKKVYIFYRKEKFFRAEPTWREEIKKQKKIFPIFNSEIIKLIGKNKLEEIEIIDNKTKEKNKIKVDGLFVEIGSVPNSKLAENLGIKLENNYIKVDKKMKTNINGVFAAGDITNNPLKQVITACSEGAIAADTVYREILGEA